MAALGKIPYVCADCGSRATRLEWTGQRWKIAVFHFRTCPVLRSQWSADAADNYLNGALREHGYASADYCDDCLIIGHSRPTAAGQPHRIAREE